MEHQAERTVVVLTYIRLERHAKCSLGLGLQGLDDEGEGGAGAGLAVPAAFQ